SVTGVQTCALPIFLWQAGLSGNGDGAFPGDRGYQVALPSDLYEQRAIAVWSRVGKPLLNGRGSDGMSPRRHVLPHRRVLDAELFEIGVVLAGVVVHLLHPRSEFFHGLFIQPDGRLVVG